MVTTVYTNPEGQLRIHLEAMFQTITARSKRQQSMLVFNINLDVLDHLAPIVNSIASASTASASIFVCAKIADDFEKSTPRCSLAHQLCHICRDRENLYASLFESFANFA